MIELSAIVPTRDRLAFLRDCLQTLVSQKVTEGLLEVIVVDDGSRHDPGTLVEELQNPRIPVRLERQEPSGLNVARNTGAVTARGRVLAYVDDDTLVPPSWATEVLTAFEQHGCEGLGGRIGLKLEGPKPRWLSPKLRRFLSEFDLGADPFWLEEGDVPFGANCAVTREAFDGAGGFVPGLDRSGESLVSNGEIEFFLRLRSGGGKILYWPSAEVLHRVPPERLVPSWFLKRAFAQGVSDVLLAPPTHRTMERWLGLARDLLRPARAGPILVRNLLEGNGHVGARVWIAYCRGRITARLQPAEGVGRTASNRR